jgi:hypothetical protein
MTLHICNFLSQPGSKLRSGGGGGGRGGVSRDQATSYFAPLPSPAHFLLRTQSLSIFEIAKLMTG